MKQTSDKLMDIDSFEQAIRKEKNTLPLFKQLLHQRSLAIEQGFTAQQDINSLVQRRSSLIDSLLTSAWRLMIPADTGVALIAVGGYGRGELHPGSDIDLMILLGEKCSEELAEKFEQLLTFLWDMGLDVGHSVRTLNQCVEQAMLDLTVITSMLESRLIIGSNRLFALFQNAIAPDRIWSSERFFEAKLEEQRQRHRKYDDTVSNLEPNIKECPGGLRDLHMIGWVAKRHFGAVTMQDLVAYDFLTESEYRELMEAQAFLWRIRFALHLLTGRHEDRLLFDYQRALADQFNFEDDEHDLAVEQFMQQYYQTAIRLNRMNEMLLQLFQEAILEKDRQNEPVAINRRFQSRNGFLEVTSNDVFDRKPLALLEIFLIFQKNPDLKGVRASTIRLIRDRRHLINNSFRADPKARQMFMKIMRQPRGALRSMNRYGILARYLPPFNWIVGRMQYDLFHVYTVDEHILCTIYNLRRFAVDEYKNEFPLCSECMSRLEKPELLYLGGLFHDIAKGRGGNHSLLGAEDARVFCETHGLTGTETDLIVWLVRKHLLMSITAQRKDISDPEVIWEFAKEVGNPVRLDYLYLLTVADIRATDPKIWNSWKNSLLRQLYTSTRQALLRGLWNPQEREEIIQNKQAGARHLLVSEGIDEARTTKLWMKLSYDYFLFHTWDEIAWHSKLILTVKDEDLPLIRIRKSQTRGGTEVFIYCLDRDYLFVHMTSLLDQLGTNIVSAQIETTDSGYTLNSFLVLEEDGGPIVGQERTDQIVRSLMHALSNPDVVDISVYRRIPRQLKFFPTPTRIDFGDDPANHRTVVKLVTDDRPGLLSQVGDAFSACDVRLTSAKIATIGAEVEDTFFITDRNNRPLTDKTQFDCLEEAIRDRVRGGLPGV